MPLRRAIDRVRSALGRESAPAEWPADFTPAEISVLERVRPFSMTSPERLVSVVRAAEHVVRHRIPGDWVECGVWRGGSTMAAALTFLAHGDTTRTLHLFDTFEGMTAPTASDVEVHGRTAERALAQEGKDSDVWAVASAEEVAANLASTGYPQDRVRLVRGPVEQTVPGAAPERISILRLDTDWYESTRHEMEHLYPRLVPGGVLILDDYGHWQGARRAVDEYVERHGLRLLLCRIDYTGRIAVKPDAKPDVAPDVQPDARPQA